MNKKYILIIDIETTNSLVDNIAYDIGYVISDLKGNILKEKSFMVSELFYDYAELLESAYYKEKIPQYWEDLKNNTREMRSITTIRKEIWDDIKKYKIKEIYAYNAAFDKRGLNKTFRYLTKSKYRWFFPFGMKFCCIWHIACQTIFKQKTFEKLAILNGWISESGNVKTNAETAYKYISKDTDFKEKHSGLDDVKIELEILLKCLRQHKKLDRSIKPNCWMIPQKQIYKTQALIKGDN